MLRIYRAPNGHTYQYEEGTQPWDHVPVDEPEPEPEPKPKRAPAKKRTTQNKARAPRNKAASKE